MSENWKHIKIIDGHIGRVDIYYVAEEQEEDILGNTVITPSYFVARSKHGVRRGDTAELALIALYQHHALFRAMEDYKNRA